MTNADKVPNLAEAGIVVPENMIVGKTEKRPPMGLQLKLSARKEALLLCTLIRAGTTQTIKMLWPIVFSSKFVNALNMAENELVRSVDAKVLGNIARTIKAFSDDEGVAAYRNSLTQETSLLAAVYVIGDLVGRGYAAPEGSALAYVMTAATQGAPILFRDTTEDMDRVNEYAEVLLSAAKNHGFLFEPRLLSS